MYHACEKQMVPEASFKAFRPQVKDSKNYSQSQ